MVIVTLLSDSLIVIAPLLVLFYNGFRAGGYFAVSHADKIDEAWEEAIYRCRQDEKLDSSEEEFAILYGLITEKIDPPRAERPDHLLLYAGGFGATSEVHSGYGERESDDHEKESLVPLVLVDKWVSDRTQELQRQRDRYVYFVAIILLFLGYSMNFLHTHGNRVFVVLNKLMEFV